MTHSASKPRWTLNFSKYIFVFLIFITIACHQKKEDYVCPPCDLPCDELSFSKPGICPHCNMTLIKRSDLDPVIELTLNEINIKNGTGQFLIEGGFDKSKTIIVHYYKPVSFTTKSKTIFVVPGAGRNGKDYRNAWIQDAEKYSLVVLSPEYKESLYPGFWSYNLAGMVKDVNIQEETFNINQNSNQWIFGDFDRIFKLFKANLNLDKSKYDMFGHSAGGQILHRLVMFYPTNNIDRILAANAGWYTMPEDEEPFPYGLKGIDLSSNEVDFSSNLTIFLGENDDANETRGHLRHTPEVDKQGLHRLARGRYYFKKAQNIAEIIEQKYNWKLEIIPGIGHDYHAMSQKAAEYLYGDNDKKALKQD